MYSEYSAVSTKAETIYFLYFFLRQIDLNLFSSLCSYGICLCLEYTVQFKPVQEFCNLSGIRFYTIWKCMVGGKKKKKYSFPH